MKMAFGQRAPRWSRCVIVPARSPAPSDEMVPLPNLAKQSISARSRRGQQRMKRKRRDVLVGDDEAALGRVAQGVADLRELDHKGRKRLRGTWMEVKQNLGTEAKP